MLNYFTLTKTFLLEVKSKQIFLLIKLLISRAVVAIKVTDVKLIEPSYSFGIKIPIKHLMLGKLKQLITNR